MTQITVPASNKTYKAKPFSRWDSFVEQFYKDHPDAKEKFKKSSDKKEKRKNDKQ